MMTPMVGPGNDRLRWPLADEDAEGRLFDGPGADRHIGRGEYRGLEFLHVNARTIINRVPSSSRMSFHYTINAYRGCSHACTYCFARPTHEFLGLGPGEDFERRIVVKVNALELARAELSSPRWGGDLIAMGTNTDPYQPAEGKYHLTRGIIGALSQLRNPFSILTKSTLVLRDLPQLAEASRRTHVRVNLSIGTLDRDVWRLTEPGTPPPDKRVEAVSRLNEAGVACGVLVAPVLPGLSDSEDQVAEVATACRRAGAVSVTPVALHLRPGVREHYLSWLAATRPDLVELYERRFRGRSYQPRAEQERLSDLVAKVTGVAGGMRPSVGPYNSEKASGRDKSRRYRAPVAAAAGNGPVHQLAGCPTAAPVQLELFSGS
jgi:DNA repair photolyase